MYLSELFYSIQGEGELTGVPSVFIRTSGCNLRCRWCDTPYASWEPEGYQAAPTEILEKVLSFPSDYVVVTGGEPLIAAGVSELARLLHAAGKHITFETAGTVMPQGIKCNLASISPKLPHSTPRPGEIEPAWIEKHESSRFQPSVLRGWITQYPYQLKFVVKTEEDLAEVKNVLEKIELPIPSHKVLLMPEGTDLITLQSRRDFLVDACKSHGYRYCERLHVALFGHTRGT